MHILLSDLRGHGRTTQRAFWASIEPLLSPRVLLGLPFVTNFNVGHGNEVFEQGQVIVLAENVGNCSFMNACV
jgi:endo-beta-N-acetylglucosaminidase D